MRSSRTKINYFQGYDMEDAMIINKSSYERGFAHGSIYKAEFIELDHMNSYFGRDPSNLKLVDSLDTDGLPFISKLMKTGDPLYCYHSADESRYIVKTFKSKEECYVNSVRLCSSFSPKAKPVACIVFRVTVNIFIYLCNDFWFKSLILEKSFGR